MELEPNEIYHATLKDSRNVNYIFRTYSTGLGHKSFICSTSTFKVYDDHRDRYNWDGYEVRESTDEEKQWLIACEKANKFIPLEEVKSKDLVIDNYEIY